QPAAAGLLAVLLRTGLLRNFRGTPPALNQRCATHQRSPVRHPVAAVRAERTMMQSDEFIEDVRERGGMVSIEDADAAVVAVLSVLARRDLCGEETKFAAQLPTGVGELFSRDGAPGQHFSAG